MGLQSAEAFRECQENWNGYEFKIQETTRELVKEEIWENATRYNVTSEKVILTKLKSFGQFPAFMMWASLTGVLVALKHLGII